MGGYELKEIRYKRNDLAHGNDSFESVGSSCTAGELLLTLRRVDAFIISFVKSIDNYIERQGYLNRVPFAAKSPPLHPARKPVEPGNSVGHLAGG